jgi:ubiquinone/menaquinone biosynthesis C-methylase UbiE
MAEDRNRVCPVELAGSLDSKLRRWIQNPEKILAPYVKDGMAVMDVGCGPGYFTIEMAAIVGETGKVYGVDLQEGMLQKIRDKIKGTYLENIITLIKCDKDKIIFPGKVDFILAFYMVHEVPDKKTLFTELKSFLAENGRILIVEPPLHVSKNDFNITMDIAQSAGLKVNAGLRLFMHQTAILSN